MQKNNGSFFFLFFSFFFKRKTNKERKEKRLRPFEQHCASATALKVDKNLEF
jgi:hypothetical protein